MITNYQASLVQNYAFGRTTFSPPTTYYLALSKTAVAANGTGMSEPSGGNYARIAIANSKTTWSTSSDGTISNLDRIEFNESTTSWGTCTHAVLMDAATGGNVLYSSELNVPRDIQANSQLYFAVGGIQFRLYGA